MGGDARRSVNALTRHVTVILGAVLCAVGLGALLAVSSQPSSELRPRGSILVAASSPDVEVTLGYFLDISTGEVSERLPFWRRWGRDSSD